MRRNVVLSILFHAAIIVIAFVGLPEFKREIEVERPIVVDILNVAPETNAPPPAPPKPAPKPEPAKAVPPAPPAPPPPPPPPPPKPSAEPAPAPLPAPKAEVAKQQPKEAEPPRPQLAKQKPPRKPPPPDDMASVLKTLEDIKQRPQKPDETAKKRTPPPPEQSFDVAEIQKSLSQQPRRHDPTKALSISEIDLVRRQIAQCWNLPAGAKDAHKMTVEIKVAMNIDGTVREATLSNQLRMAADPFYRAMAESALRAVLNPRCQPFKLPPDRYEIWQTMELNFDPREML